MAPLLANLIPIPSLGAEVLRAGTPTRPLIEVHQAAEKFLGRNSTTQIHDPRISRKIAAVAWRFPNDSSASSWELTLKLQVGTQGKVNVNDMPATTDTPLFDGDIIAVLASDLTVSYSYRVEIPDHPTSTTTTTTTSNSGAKKRPAPAATEAAAPAAPTVDVSQEFVCAVCLDILVEAMTAVPCGHSFCRSCIAGNVRQCPTCRTRLVCQPFPSRQLDEAIAQLVDGQPEMFQGDDVEQYYTRSNRTKPPAAASVAAGAENAIPNKKIKGKSAADAIVID